MKLLEFKVSNGKVGVVAYQIAAFYSNSTDSKRTNIRLKGDSVPLFVDEEYSVVRQKLMDYKYE